LERGEQCKCFASGMAAINAALFNSVQAGDLYYALATFTGKNADKLVKEHVSPGLIRVSVGMEPTEKLKADLEQALEWKLNYLNHRPK
jgi:cystathionine beta-lyase/cystathionine gamma-synthase